MQAARIHRERIVARLSPSPEHRVTLLVAAAGTGKSVALAQSLDPQRGDAYYRVAPHTTTLLAFLRGLTDALESNVPGAHLSFAIAYERAIQAPAPTAGPSAPAADGEELDGRSQVGQSTKRASKFAAIVGIRTTGPRGR